MSSSDDYEDEGAYSDMEQDPGVAAQSASVSAPARRPPIYNTAALLEKLDDIAWTAQAGWQDTQVITGTDAEQVEDVEDDLTRELSFYSQALEASQEAISRFDSAGTPWLRPRDYYAEMVKSDDHMARVKQQLMYEQTQLEQAEERRKQREGRKFQKAVHAERLKEKAQSKKRGIENISRLRRNRARSGYAGDVDVDAALGEGVPSSAKAGPKRAGERLSSDRHQVGKKRQAKNEKFGFGGRKRLKKQNDASSAADMEGFRQGKFDDGHGGRRGQGRGQGRGGAAAVRQSTDAGFRMGRQAGKGKQGKINRPGKARRQAMRSE